MGDGDGDDDGDADDVTPHFPNEDEQLYASNHWYVPDVWWYYDVAHATTYSNSRANYLLNRKCANMDTRESHRYFWLCPRVDVARPETTDHDG